MRENPGAAGALSPLEPRCYSPLRQNNINTDHLYTAAESGPINATTDLLSYVPHTFHTRCDGSSRTRKSCRSGRNLALRHVANARWSGCGISYPGRNGNRVSAEAKVSAVAHAAFSRLALCLRFCRVSSAVSGSLRKRQRDINFRNPQPTDIFLPVRWVFQRINGWRDISIRRGVPADCRANPGERGQHLGCGHCRSGNTPPQSRESNVT